MSKVYMAGSETTREASLLGKEFTDLPGRKFKVIGINQGPYGNLVRLQMVGSKYEGFVSPFELQHYYKSTETIKEEV